MENDSDKRLMLARLMGLKKYGIVRPDTTDPLEWEEIVFELGRLIEQANRNVETK